MLRLMSPPISWQAVLTPRQLNIQETVTPAMWYENLIRSQVRSAETVRLRCGIGHNTGAKEEIMIKFTIINSVRYVNPAVVAGLVFAARLAC